MAKAAARQWPPKTLADWNALGGDWRQYAANRLDELDRAGIPDLRDPKQRRRSDQLTEQMAREQERALSPERYKAWRAWHEEAKKSRQEYREALKRVEEAGEALENASTKREKDDAAKKLKEAEEDAEQKRKKWLNDEMRSEMSSNPEGSIPCNADAAEWCVDGPLTLCHLAGCTEEECTCTLTMPDGEPWNPELQKKLREGEKAEEASGGGGGHAADPLDALAAAIGAVLGVISPFGLLAGVGAALLSGGAADKGDEDDTGEKEDKGGKGHTKARREHPVGPPPADPPGGPIGPPGGRKGLAGVDPRGGGRTVSERTTPPPPPDEGKTKAPPGGRKDDDPKTTAEHKPTARPDDSTTTAEGGTSAKRPCMTCADAMNSIASNAKTKARLKADVECLWTAASLTTGANGEPLTDGLADEKAAIDKNLARLASLDMGAEATAVRDEAQEQMVDLIKELSRRCGKAMRGEVVLPHGTVAQESKGPPPPGGGNGGDGEDDERTYVQRKIDCLDRLSKILDSRDIHDRLKALNKMYQNELGKDESLAKIQAAERSGTVPPLMPDINLPLHVKLHYHEFSLIERLLVICGGKGLYDPTASTKTHWAGMPPTPWCRDLKALIEKLTRDADELGRRENRLRSLLYRAGISDWTRRPELEGLVAGARADPELIRTFRETLKDAWLGYTLVFVLEPVIQKAVRRLGEVLAGGSRATMKVGEALTTADVAELIHVALKADDVYEAYGLKKKFKYSERERDRAHEELEKTSRAATAVRALRDALAETYATYCAESGSDTKNGVNSK